MSQKAKRSLGQNFLVDDSVIQRILSAAGVRSDEVVIEIGPGRGALTDGLRARGRHLICIEKDDGLAASLDRRYSKDDSVTIVNGDALILKPEDMPVPGPYRIAANLPYNVGGRITMHLLEEWHGQVLSATLMFQKEVADRITAAPATKPYGALSVLVQSMAEAWSLFKVPPGAFRPIPKVQSAVVRLKPRETQLWQGLDYEWFRRVVHGGFQARRKTILNSLSLASGLPSDTEVLRAALTEVGLDPGIRGDSVPVEAWVRLAAALAR